MNNKVDVEEVISWLRLPHYSSFIIILFQSENTWSCWTLHWRYVMSSDFFLNGILLLISFRQVGHKSNLQVTNFF